MGQLIDGVWLGYEETTHNRYDTKSTGGRFKRSVSAFRNWLTADGAPLAPGDGGFAAEKIVIIFMFSSPARGRTAR